jgi:hypothetical protein
MTLLSRGLFLLLLLYNFLFLFFIFVAAAIVSRKFSTRGGVHTEIADIQKVVHVLLACALYEIRSRRYYIYNHLYHLRLPFDDSVSQPLEYIFPLPEY